MPVVCSKLKMRDWLQTQLGSGKFPGLQWIDREEGVFRVPWKHASKQNWRFRDSDLFREWAIHTGKYRAGEKPDPKKWKANFRCALNARKDVVQLSERSKPHGNSAFRVYAMKPQNKQRKPRKSKENAAPTDREIIDLIDKMTHAADSPQFLKVGPDPLYDLSQWYLWASFPLDNVTGYGHDAIGTINT